MHLFLCARSLGVDRSSGPNNNFTSTLLSDRKFSRQLGLPPPPVLSYLYTYISMGCYQGVIKNHTPTEGFNLFGVRTQLEYLIFFYSRT